MSEVPTLQAVLIELAEEHEARASALDHRQAYPPSEAPSELRERAQACREAAQDIRF